MRNKPPFDGYDYVRLYADERPPVNWLMLPWQSRALYPLILASPTLSYWKGELSLEEHDPVKVVSLATNTPEDFVGAGLPPLLRADFIQHDTTRDLLFLPHFVQAQPQRAWPPVLPELQDEYRPRILRPSRSMPVRRAVRERDGNLCRYCGEIAEPIWIDHVLPIARGGMETVENMVVSCRSCNLHKSDRTLEELDGMVLRGL